MSQRNKIKISGYVELQLFLYCLFLQLYEYLDIHMNNSFSSQQIQKTSNRDANLLSRQNKLNLMADFMRLKHETPKMKESEIANQLSFSSSTIQRYRNDINMLPPYRFNPNYTNKRTEKVKKTNFDNDSQPNHDDKRHQMTSKQLKQNLIRKIKIF